MLDSFWPYTACPLKIWVYFLSIFGLFSFLWSFIYFLVIFGYILATFSYHFSSYFGTHFASYFHSMYIIFLFLPSHSNFFSVNFWSVSSPVNEFWDGKSCQAFMIQNVDGMEANLLHLLGRQERSSWQIAILTIVENGLEEKDLFLLAGYCAEFLFFKELSAIFFNFAWEEKKLKCSLLLFLEDHKAAELRIIWTKLKTNQLK